MHEARSTIDGHLYTAEEFDQQSAAVKAAHRPSKFTCPLCGGEAFFRARSANGVAACFGARHAREDCPAKAATRPDTPTPGVETVPALDNSGAVLVIDWDGIPGSAAATGPSMTHAVDPTQEGPTLHHDPAAGTVASERTQRKLRVLLRRFEADPSLAGADQLVQVAAGQAPVPMRELVVTPERITVEHEDHFHLIWGTLSSAERLSNGTAFLRCRHPEGGQLLRLRLTRELAAALWEHLGWSADTPEARGVRFLAGGTVQRKQDPQAVPFLSLDSTAQIAVLLAPAG